jgi:hypothetical protein
VISSDIAEGVNEFVAFSVHTNMRRKTFA